MKVTLLDTTLRDGGHVIGGNFNVSDAVEITSRLGEAGIERIEIGMIVSPDAAPSTTFVHQLVDLSKIVSLSNCIASPVAMVRPDWTKANSLEPTAEIKQLRIAFKREWLPQLTDYTQTLVEAGFDCDWNPIDTPQYTENELTEMLSLANENNVGTVNIVDTYGRLTLKDFQRMVDIFDTTLSPEVGLGIHLHENKLLAMGLASWLVFSSPLVVSERNVSFDATLFGMGRLPGNLRIEAWAGELVSTGLKEYKIRDILDLVDGVILPMFERNPWGYDLHYLSSALVGFDRNLTENIAQYLAPGPYYSALLKATEVTEQRNSSAHLSNLVRKLGEKDDR